MKKQILVLLVLIGAGIYTPASAQVSVHINLGLQPIWGPVGYDYVDYYYIPDIESYYSVSSRQYTYYDGGRWVTTGHLPPRYRNFDLYNAHKVVINERTPWIHNDRYRGQYAQYRGRHDQVAIRSSHDERYFENPHHPEHNKWHGNNGRGNEGHGNPGHGNQGGGDRGRGNEGHGNPGGGDRERGNQGHGNPGGGEGHGGGDHGHGRDGH